RLSRLARSIDWLTLNVLFNWLLMMFVYAPWKRCFELGENVSFSSNRRVSSVLIYGIFVITSWRLDCWVCARPAPKNQRRSFITGPPTVYSYVGMTRSICVSLAKASPGCFCTSDRQLSLFSVSRNDPEKRLPPDLVTMFTTPPVNRPYSAE